MKICDEMFAIFIVAVNENPGDKEQLESCMERKANVIHPRSYPAAQAGELYFDFEEIERCFHQPPRNTCSS